MTKNYRGGSWSAATSKMEHFLIIVNGWKPLTIITKSSILDVATVLDPPLNYQSLFISIVENLSYWNLNGSWKGPIK